MKEIPESEIQAIFSLTRAKKHGELLAKKLQIFALLISRKSGREKFHEMSSAFSTRAETKFFHCEILGVGGPK